LGFSRCPLAPANGGVNADGTQAGVRWHRRCDQLGKALGSVQSSLLDMPERSDTIVLIALRRNARCYKEENNLKL